MYTEVSNEGWFSRIGGAIKGLLFGLLLFVIAFPILFWNEGRSVARYKALEEGAGAVVSIEADDVDDANNDKLVHLSGELKSKEKLSDDKFQLEVEGLHLKRRVEMYQWKENVETSSKKKLGGGKKTVKEYTYEKVWADGAIDSDDFKLDEEHHNPPLPVDQASVTNSSVTLGAFTVPDPLKDELKNFEDLKLTKEMVKIPASLDGHVEDGMIVTGDGSPEIGDIRISFSVVELGDATLLAQQDGSNLVPFETGNDDTLFMAYEGLLSSEAVFKRAEAENATLTWILRAVGFFMMLIGLFMIFRPLSVLADVVPFFGSLVSAGTGLIAFFIAVACATTTVGIAWIFYRPLLGVPLILAAVGALFLTFKKMRSARPTPAAG